MNILTGRQGGGYSRLVTGLPGARDSAGDVGIAPGAILRCDAHIDEVAFNQDRSVDDVLIGTDDGEEGAVGRRYVDLAEKRV